VLAHRPPHLYLPPPIPHISRSLSLHLTRRHRRHGPFLLLFHYAFSVLPLLLLVLSAAPPLPSPPSSPPSLPSSPLLPLWSFLLKLTVGWCLWQWPSQMAAMEAEVRERGGRGRKEGGNRWTLAKPPSSSGDSPLPPSLPPSLLPACLPFFDPIFSGIFPPPLCLPSVAGAPRRGGAAEPPPPGPRAGVLG
jgi:hypothetical protein